MTRGLTGPAIGLLMTALASAVPPAASAAIDVSVTGHESLSAREVRRTLIGREDDHFDEQLLSAGVDSLLSRLAGLGRPFATVSASWDTADGNVVLNVVMDEGPEVRIGRARLAGPEVRPGVEKVGLRPGSALTREAVEREVTAVLGEYADAGYPFASITLPRGIDVRDGEADLTLRVEPGVETRFGGVVVSGNEQTRDYVIVRETGIEPGELYDRAAVENVRPRLERLSFLRSVAEPVVAVDPVTGEATLGVEVAEAAANRISGVFGFSGTGGDEELTGLVDLSLGNIAGTGRSASVSWEQFRANQTEISFSYLEPWLLGAPIDVGLSGAQSVRDTLYTTTEGDLFVTARAGERTRITWSLGAERYVPGSGDESSTTSARTALSADYDARDAPINPTAGLRVTGGVTYAAKDVAETGANERSGVFRLGAERYLSVTRNQVIALVARAALLSSTEKDVPFYELLTLGGARSLRGYREEQFRGTRTALGTIEYRFLLTRRSRALAFVDVGYWYLGGSNPAKDTKLGYGIGLRGETRLGTISIDYGLGEGDGLLDGKLHAGLAREF